MAKHKPRSFIDGLPVNILRMIMNLWPPYLGSGIKVTKMTKNYRHIEVSLSLRWYNRNYVGTHYGASIFSMTDPFYMLMLLKNLGRDYIVWVKSAYIDFKKPGRGKLTATFKLPEEDLGRIRAQTEKQDKFLFERTNNVLDQSGEVVATVVQTLFVKRKK